MNPGLKYGIIAGIVTILYFTAFYWVNPSLMLHWAVFYTSLLFYLGGMLLAVREQRREQAGALTFQEGLRTAFTTYLVANLLYYGFYYGLHQYDPGLADIQKQAMAEFLPKITMKDQLPQALRDLEKRDFGVDLGTAAFGYARAAIGGFILALGVGYLNRSADS
ncbi:MAG: DUF4199 domain-containing protein [Phaeodactylibacter sp.]|nr:DUF4199 domain-containing protein [Phaeodactylibacter sp.]